MRSRLAQPTPVEPFFDQEGGSIARVWWRYVSRVTDLLSGVEPIQARAYTVAELMNMDAADWRDCQVMVTDEHSGRVPAYSDGSHWRRYSDNAEVTT